MLKPEFSFKSHSFFRRSELVHFNVNHYSEKVNQGQSIWTNVVAS